MSDPVVGGSTTDHPPSILHAAGVAPGSFAIPNPQPHYRPASFSHQADALSLKAMTQRFYTWFRDSGMLSALQTQFRAQIIQQIPRRHLIHAQVQINADAANDMMRLGKGKLEVPIMQRVVNSLIVEYFAEFDYPFALSIFGPESGTRAESGQLGREDILRLLRVQCSGGSDSPHTWAARRLQQALQPDTESDKENDSRVQVAAVREGYDTRHSATVAKRRAPSASWAKRSVLALLLDALATQPQQPTMLDSGCQTDEAPSSSTSIDHKLKVIDDEYLDAHLREREALFPTLQERMVKFECEQAEKFKYELDMEKKRFADQELARMRLEERQRYRADEEKLRRDLRAESEAHLARVRREQEELIAKYQTKERELGDQLFRERQSLQENMNLLHNREIELSRKRDLLEKTQLLSEQKTREADRLLTTRATELEYLTSNLNRKVDDETARVRADWEPQVRKRDELLARAQEQLAASEARLSKKTAELADSVALANEYERELRAVGESKKSLEADLSAAQHAHSLATARVNELDTRRATLEEAVLTSTAKEQVCFHHLAELATLRTRLQEQADAHDDTTKKMRERNAADLLAEQGQAQAALQLAHQQATSMAQQWKSAYTDVLEDVERRRAEEEHLRQQLEEQALVARELKREVAALRTGVARQGGGYHIAPLPSTVPSAAPYVPAHLAASMPASARPAHEAPPFPPLAAAQITAVAAATIAPPPSIPPPSIPPSAPLPVISSAATAASLDAEFFARESALDADSTHLAHQLSLHASRAATITGAEKRHAAREATVRAEADRAVALQSVARDYQRQQDLPVVSNDPPSSASPSEDAFSAQAAARQRELHLEQRAFIERARDDEANRRAQLAADDLDRRQREREWQEEQARIAREKEAANALAQTLARLEAEEKAAKAREAAAALEAAAAQSKRDAEVAAAIAAANATVAAAEAAAAQAKRDVDLAAAAAAAQAQRDADAAELARQQRDADTKRLISEAAAVAAPAIAAPAAATATPLEPAPISAPTTKPAVADEEEEEESVEDAARLAEEEAQATRLRLERERVEAAEREREARQARRLEGRAAREKSPTNIAPSPVIAAAPVFSGDLTDAERAEQAVAELEAEKAAKRAARRAEEQLEAERREREEVERQVQAQAQQAADPAAASSAEQPVEYDEAATAAFYAAAAANGGYYDEYGQWVTYPYDQNAYAQYAADPAAYSDANQQYYAEQGYADPAQSQYTQQPYADHAYDANAYQQPSADAASYAYPTAASDAAIAAVHDDDGGISEASAEISAPPSDTEIEF